MEKMKIRHANKNKQKSISNSFHFNMAFSQTVCPVKVQSTLNLEKRTSRLNISSIQTGAKSKVGNSRSGLRYYLFVLVVVQRSLVVREWARAVSLALLVVKGRVVR